jgi:hypothetical protein
LKNLLLKQTKKPFSFQVVDPRQSLPTAVREGGRPQPEGQVGGRGQEEEGPERHRQQQDGGTRVD